MKEETPFYYSNFVNLMRVPTATMLIRILLAEKNKQGKPKNLEDYPPEHQMDEAFVPTPEYKDGVYNNEYFNIEKKMEAKIMKLRRKRPNPPLMDVFNELLVRMGKNIESMNQF